MANYTLTPLPITIPQGWPATSYDFTSNPLTQEGFELGKKLFYDGILSKDGNFPCASCHQQFGAFNNYDHVMSHGFNNQLTTRNSPALQNLAWMKSYMWDGSISHLEEQFFLPINAPNEMAETTESVLDKLNKDSFYIKAFTQVFGKGSITKDKLGKALSQYVLQLVSNNSKYDQVMNGTASFTPGEAEGYAIFKKKCNSCHTEPLFTNNKIVHNGIQLDYNTAETGRMLTTKDSNDIMKFRVPSLRNAQVTFPYGHDGRFYRLYNAILHYNNITELPSTDDKVKGLQITPYETGRLIAFINTLTDSSFLTNPKFAPKGYIISPSLMHTH